MPHILVGEVFGVRELALPLIRILNLVDKGRAFCNTLGHGRFDNSLRAHLHAPIDTAPERNVGWTASNFSYHSGSRSL